MNSVEINNKFFYPTTIQDYKHLKRSKIEFEICKIKEKQNIIIKTELNIILSQMNGYKYNNKNKKIDKHYPLINKKLSFEDYMNKYNNDKDVSCSLSSEEPIIIENQLNEILQTVLRRYNKSTLFNDDELIELLYKKNDLNIPIFTTLDTIYYLQKYDKIKDIKTKFPDFYDELTKRTFFDTIYTVQTENFQYIDKNNKTFCNTILVCLNKKILNIFFKLDTKHPYIKLKTYSFVNNEKFIKCMYYNDFKSYYD